MARLVYCDGILWGELMRAGLANLALHKEHINALNVFPIPDGDTGTNMLLTMRFACDKVNGGVAHAGEAARVLAQGALLGARGNSGVILSQLWRGFAEIVAGHGQIDGVLFAKALRHSAELAHKSVTDPVEGTILTIARAMADSAETSSQTHNDFHTILTNVVTASKIALAHTPEQLPILKQAGVVDSGGQGLVCIFEGMLRWLDGDLTHVALQSPMLNHAEPTSAQQLARPASGVLTYPYDVQFILTGENLNLAEIRDQIDRMGD
ncbi:MAG TPA: DAK2 domain-containing protein, partial [Anaerolineae bacterium]|nr:DAK2 domain-containing protein [Anaerolineae bacterium]